MLRVWAPWVCISSITIFCSMTHSKYLCRSLLCHLRVSHSSFYSSFSFSWGKKVIFLHCSKMEADLKKQYLVYGIFFWPETWRGSLYIKLPPLICQIPDFNYWTVLIFILIYFEWRDTENQQLYRDWLFFITSGLVPFPFWVQKKTKIDHRFFIFVFSTKNDNWTQIFIFLNFTF